MRLISFNRSITFYSSSLFSNLCLWWLNHTPIHKPNVVSATKSHSSGNVWFCLTGNLAKKNKKTKHIAMYVNVRRDSRKKVSKKEEEGQIKR